jgi:hypothetical protein
MKRKPLQVSIHARESSVVEVTVGECVQLDRLARSPHGTLAERLGRLLDPGSTTVALEAGHYFFRTLSDANLRVVSGGVSAGIVAHNKDPWPDPPSDGPALPAPDGKGDDVPGELPSFSIEWFTAQAGEIA